MVPPPSHVIQPGVDGRGVDVVPSEALEQFVGVETYRFDHALLGMELLLNLLKNDIVIVRDKLSNIANHA